MLSAASATAAAVGVGVERDATTAPVQVPARAQPAETVHQPGATVLPAGDQVVMRAVFR